MSATINITAMAIVLFLSIGAFYLFPLIETMRGYSYENRTVYGVTSAQ